MKTINPTGRGFTAAYDEVDAVLVLELVVDRLIDFSLIADIETDIMQLLAKLEPSVVVLGFQNVSVFSSEIISVVLALQRKMFYLNGALKLTGLRPGIGEVFHQLNLDETTVEIHDTTIEALADVQREPQVT